MRKKNLKFRKNVKEFVDADYLDKLSPEDREYYEKFTNEYYSNAVGNPDSLHRQALEGKDEILCQKCQKKEDAFTRAKKSTYDANNASNKDAYAISATGTYLNFIDSDDFYKQLVQPLKNEINIIAPEKAFQVLAERAEEELDTGDGRETSIILLELSMEMVKLGASVSQARSQSILKKRRLKKEAKAKPVKKGPKK